VQDKPLARPDDTDSSARGKNGPETKVAVEKTLEKTADRCRGPKGKKTGRSRESSLVHRERLERVFSCGLKFVVFVGFCHFLCFFFVYFLSSWVSSSPQC